MTGGLLHDAGAGGLLAALLLCGHMVGDFVREYVEVCEWLGVPRDDRLNPQLAKYLEY